MASGRSSVRCRAAHRDEGQVVEALRPGEDRLEVRPAGCEDVDERCVGVAAQGRCGPSDAVLLVVSAGGLGPAVGVDEERLARCEQRLEMRLPASPGSLSTMRRGLQAWLRHAGVSAPTVYDVMVAARCTPSGVSTCAGLSRKRCSTPITR